MPNPQTERRDSGEGCAAKAEGAFIGLAAGDALGWPQEFPSRVVRRAATSGSPSTAFRQWTRKSGGRYYAHEEVIRPGEYSDDTQLLLAVARSRLFPGANWWTALTRTELPLWTLYERGGGGATKRAVDLWVKGVQPWKAADAKAVQQYFDAGGNGVAMRVLPHAVAHAKSEDAAALMRDVMLDGVATHGHPRALVGATSYAYAAWWLLRAHHTVAFGELLGVMLAGETIWGGLPAVAHPKAGWMEAADQWARDGYAAVWSSVVGEMVSLLKAAQQGIEAGALAEDDAVLKQLGCFGRAKGAGTVSAAAAAYLCSRYAAQPVQAVLTAAFAHGSDTDTIAAMTGGLAGCLSGRDWLPAEWLRVQDVEYLRRLAVDLARGPHGEEPGKERPQPVGARDLDGIRARLSAGPSGDIPLGGTRSANVFDFVALRPISKTTVAQRWHLRTSDGQTLYVTKLGRLPKGGASTSSPEHEPAARRQPEATEAGARAHAAGVKLTVTDMSASANFYGNLLGLFAVKRTPRFVSFGAISLVDARTAVELSEGAVQVVQAACRNRVAVHVTDLQPCLERLAESGVQVGRVITLPWGERSVHVVDPDGNVVELIEKRGGSS